MAYVIVSVSLRCPFCGQTSVERLVAETERFDHEQVAGILRRQSYECQLCQRTLPDGTFASAHAELATPLQLEQMGFAATPMPQNAPCVVIMTDKEKLLN